MTTHKSIEEIIEEFEERSNDKMFCEDECKNSFWFEEGDEIRYDQDAAGAWLKKQMTKYAQQQVQEAVEAEREETREILKCVRQIIEINATNLDNYIIGQTPPLTQPQDTPNQ
jgi:hypothetical protein